MMQFDLPVSFYFSVQLEINGALSSDTSFMEVSGMSVSIDTQNYKNGNDPLFLPTGVKYGNLTLKRGITPMNSPFSQWCQTNLLQESPDYITTGNLQVSLLNENADPVCKWTFLNAYPIKWSIDAFNSKKNDLAIETIEICYSRFNRMV